MNTKELLENLIEVYGNDVLRIATLYTQNPNIAEDIFQDVFLKVNKSLYSFKGNCSEKTWIIRITINTCKDYLKSAWKKKIVPIENLPESYSEDILNNNISSENSNLIIKEILSLPLKYKEVIILYYYKDFSTLEIAKILNIPEATVRTRMKRARELLKEKLKIIFED